MHRPRDMTSSLLKQYRDQFLSHCFSFYPNARQKKKEREREREEVHRSVWGRVRPPCVISLIAWSVLYYYSNFATRLVILRELLLLPMSLPSLSYLLLYLRKASDICSYCWCHPREETNYKESKKVCNSTQHKSEQQDQGCVGICKQTVDCVPPRYCGAV
jgi:hypothetical protein